METQYVTYRFEYSDNTDNECVEYPATRNIDVTTTFSDDVTWMTVADEFFRFLSNIYGYNIDSDSYANKK